MDLSALRSSGITKSTNRQGRRPGKSACTACHIRKKRCDAAPPYYQCTFCRKEDQLCIPRDPVERPVHHLIPNRNTNSNTNLTSCTINDQSHKEKVIPLPPGIDHEIPRWSAFYSVYTEMQRLLPPSASPSPSPGIEEDNPPAPRRSVEEDKEAPVPEMESPKHHPSGLLDGDCADGGISKPALQTRSAPSSRRQLYLDQTLGTADNLHDKASSMARVENDRDIGSTHDVFMNDLDALLRF